MAVTAVVQRGIGALDVWPPAWIMPGAVLSAAGLAEPVLCDALVAYASEATCGAAMASRRLADASRLSAPASTRALGSVACRLR